MECKVRGHGVACQAGCVTSLDFYPASSYLGAVSFHSYPHHASEPGFVTCLDVLPPVGGWVCLYDVKKGAFPPLAKVKGAGRWVVLYRPGKKFVRFHARANAREAMEMIRDGKNGQVKGVPVNLVPPKEQWLKDTKPAIAPPPSPPKPQVVTPQKKEEKPPARVRDAKKKPLPAKAVKPAKPAEKAPPPPSPAPETNFHVEFRRLMTDEFTAEKLVKEMKAGFSATKTYVSAGEAVTVPDWQVRERYLRLAVEMAEGKAKERPVVKEAKKVSFDELTTMIRRSPAARKALLREIMAAENSEEGKGE